MAAAAGVVLAGNEAPPVLVPFLLPLLFRRVRPFHRPGGPLQVAALLVGWLHGAAVLPVGGVGLPDLDPASGARPTDASWRGTGWYESAGDRGAVLHTRDGPVRLSIQSGLGDRRDGTRVRIVGSVLPPWRAGASPSVRVDSLAAAPGPPSAIGARVRLRAALRQRIHEVFPDQAGLVAALVIADRSGLDAAVREDFTRTGTAHLLAISGFHVGILAGWVVLLLGAMGLNRRRRILVAAGCVWLYVGLIGFPTSAVRAGLLITALATGRIRGRPVHLPGAWGAALLTVALVAPEQILSPGTQLSFAGSLGLLLWARPWGRVVAGERPDPGARVRARVRYVVGSAVAASAAAQVATLPFVVLHFQRVALLGLPASVLATPPVAFALPGVLVSLVLSFVPGPIAAVVAAGVEGLLAATVVVIGAMSSLDGGLWVGPMQMLGGGAGLLIARTMVNRSEAVRRSRRGPGPETRPRRHGLRSMRLVVGVVAGGMVAPVLPGGFAGDDLQVHLLDVGQGDAIAVRTPRGRWVLVDAGPGPGEEVVRGLVLRGASRLEALVLTHPDLDHIGGAAIVVDQLPVGRVLGSGLLRGTEAVSDLAKVVDRSGVDWAILRTGDRWILDGVEFTVLHAGGTERMPPNDHSVVLHLRFGEFDLLLTGDVGSEVEDLLPARLPSDTRVEILKLAHHGSRTSTSAEFLDALAPSFAVASLGRRNRFGHPAPEVTARLQERSIPLVRTDHSGAIRIDARRDGGFKVRGEHDPGN